MKKRVLENQEPCPFCGSDKVEYRENKVVILECPDCHVMFIMKTRQEAIEAWNRRPSTIDSPADINTPPELSKEEKQILCDKCNHFDVFISTAKSPRSFNKCINWMLDMDICPLVKPVDDEEESCDTCFDKSSCKKG